MLAIEYEIHGEQAALDSPDPVSIPFRLQHSHCTVCVLFVCFEGCISVGSSVSAILKSGHSVGVGEVSDSRFFTVNQAYDETKGFDLVLQNPSFSSRPWGSTARLTKVLLEYRIKDQYEWFSMKDVSDTAIDLKSKPGSYGYFTAQWKTSNVADGEYEIRARTVCSIPTGMSASTPGVAGMTSMVIPGRIDRDGPRVFDTKPTMTGAQFLPGSVVEVSFDEPIACEAPFLFDVEVKVGSFHTYTKTSSDILILCERNKISVTLQKYLDYNHWADQDLSVVVSKVKDLVGNEMGAPATFTFGVFKVATDTAGMLVEKLFLETDPKKMHDTDRIAREIEALAKVDDSSRVTVHSALPSLHNGKKGMLVDFAVEPPKSREPTQSALEIVRRLHQTVRRMQEKREGRGSSLMAVSNYAYPYLRKAVLLPSTSFKIVPSAEDKAAYLSVSAGRNSGNMEMSVGTNTPTVIHLLIVLIVLVVISLAFLAFIASRSKVGTPVPEPV